MLMAMNNINQKTYTMDKETLELLIECRDLMQDISFSLEECSEDKKLIESQVKKLNGLLIQKPNHMFI